MRGILRTIMLAAAVFGMAGNALVEDWKLAKDENGVRVYLSSVQDSKYKAYCGVTDIKVDTTTIEALQGDVGGSCKWVHTCAKMKFLRREGVDTWTYSKINMSWPVTGRGVVIHVTTEKTADGTMIHHLKADPTYIPGEKGQIRMPRLVDEWKLQSKEQDATEVTYQAETGPGGGIPSWLTNSFVVDAPLNTLKGLRSVTKKR